MASTVFPPSLKLYLHTSVPDSSLAQFSFSSRPMICFARSDCAVELGVESRRRAREATMIVLLARYLIIGIGIWGIGIWLRSCGNDIRLVEGEPLDGDLRELRNSEC